jgi:hypothetical protein
MDFAALFPDGEDIVRMRIGGIGRINSHPS